MTRWLAAVALGTALACQTGASSQGANATLLDDPAARRLMVTLIELSVGPTPVGLPEHFTVATRALPNAGDSVEVAWQALDGDPTAEPRQGSGSLTLASDGGTVTIALGADAQAPGVALTMTGTFGAPSFAGSFIDRLFSPRAGKFTAEFH
jgi:hypothetical protein